MNQKVNFNGKQYYVGNLFEFLNLDIQKLKIALKRTNDIDKAFQLVLCFSGYSILLLQVFVFNIVYI